MRSYYLQRENLPSETLSPCECGSNSVWLDDGYWRCSCCTPPPRGMNVVTAKLVENAPESVREEHHEPELVGSF